MHYRRNEHQSLNSKLQDSASAKAASSEEIAIAEAKLEHVRNDRVKQEK
jgi:hypothetical protein